MTQLLRPIASLLVGLALAVYGAIHTVSGYPGGEAFAELAAHLPAVGSVLVFLLAVTAFGGGVVLIVTGIRTLRFRWRRLDRLARHARIAEPEYDEPEPWEAAYR